MVNLDLLKKSIPVAPIKIAALPGCEELANTVNDYLVEYRKALSQEKTTLPFAGYFEDSFLIECECPRFGTGEAKGRIRESVRGTDLYIMCDVTNYSMTYKVCGYENHMSPDDHYQNLKGIISAATGKAHRINVVMPFLYESRQHKRSQRESLDCAIALRELSEMGVSNIITFDAHDPRGQNAMSRAVYFSNVLGVDMGMFYKRRDYSTIVNGKNPIVAHEFLGDSIEGKDVIIIDDMISSGESMLDVARKVKERKANRVFICTTFGLFTEGLSKFDEYYEKGYIEKVVTTDLIYRTPELKSKPYYEAARMGKYLASILDILNHDVSVEKVRSTTSKITQLLERQKNLK